MHKLGHILAQHGFIGQRGTTPKNEREQKNKVSRSIFNEVKHHSPGTYKRTGLNPLSQSQLWDMRSFLFVISSENMAESCYLLRALQGPRDQGLQSAPAAEAALVTGRLDHICQPLTSLLSQSEMGKICQATTCYRLLFLGRIMSKQSLQFMT